MGWSRQWILQKVFEKMVRRTEIEMHSLYKEGNVWLLKDLLEF